MRNVLFVMLTLFVCAGAADAESPAATGAYSVGKFGAKGDGEAKDTAAVQKAIDACAEAGGGTVYFAPGTYLCGSLHLRSGVTLWLDAGAAIKGSPDKADYDPYEKLDFKNEADVETTFFHCALLWAEDIEHIAILGSGTIDANRMRRQGPKAIALKRCRYVDIKGVRIINIANYAISLLGTDYVNIDGVTIQNAYADGIDPDSCRNVRIENCHIESHDDAIVPKASFALGERRSCENITVTNCYLATDCHCFKLGTESGGDFKRIAVSNCVMSGLGRRAINGIALESVDGSNIDGVVVSNVTMTRVRCPIFIRLGNRGRDMEPDVPGSLKNVIISDVVASDAVLASSITGIPGANVEGVTLANIRTVFAGGTMLWAADQPVPEEVPKYPDPDMFGPLPAYGLYCRHVKDLTLDNVQLLAADGFWRATVPDHDDIEWPADGGPPKNSAPGILGPAMVCDDVSGLDVDGLHAQPSTGGEAVLRLINVRDALIRGCVAPEGTKVFLETTGPETKGISLIANDLARAETPVTSGPGAPANGVASEANRTR